MHRNILLRKGKYISTLSVCPSSINISIVVLDYYYFIIIIVIDIINIDMFFKPELPIVLLRL
jgi:hypothetical protein